MSIQDDLIRDEGQRLKPYMDTVGKLTIGVGRNLNDVGISEEESRQMLNADIDRAESGLRRTFTWFLTAPEPVQRGLTNMAFNMGIMGLTQFGKMLSALASEDYDLAAAEALKSKWADQVGERAVRIANLFISAKETTHG
jgi:lysozyme